MSKDILKIYLDFQENILMDYVYRLKNRLINEGFYNSFKYIFYVVRQSAYEFFRDSYLDIKFCKRTLKGNLKTTYKHMGANDIYHTSYSAMPIIFNRVKIAPEDVLVDVGCGKGRVIVYWLSKGYKNKIYGLEIDTKIAACTARQFRNRENVNIITGDAIAGIPDEGTIFYFYNPFSIEKVIEFEQKLHIISKTKQIKIIYYNPKSIKVFQNNKWKIEIIDFEKDFGIKRWGRLNKYHDLAIISNI
jgi:SAM-dependent methyltransferase